MRSIKKFAFSFMLIALATLVISAPISASASSESLVYTRVLDRDGNLTASEEMRIYDAIADAEEATGVIFLVAVYDASEGIPSGESAISSFGFSHRTDNVVLLIIECDDFENYYEMFTYGEAYDLISNRAADRILDSSDVYDNIKGGNLADGAIAFVNRTAYKMEKELSGEIYIAPEDIWLIVGISLAAGIISVVIVIIIYKTKLKSPIYPLSQFADLELTESGDFFLGKTVTRTKISSSSGSGSSSGGGGGSRGRR
jgi:uncharacterized membrane protein YgcG